ncbi:putative hydrolase of the HAD superfamily [Streptomyces sp. V4I23]|uniref:HAD family hydrolase n=1 Tax=Streptomyces sp. V4I23 TaxID=3042282 RepID=UPI002786A3CE|nr:HAD family hydrolase [Streptomyces sp. V4I23]MDQ1010994.1 putative hydrolase of the HAD superfamily [Streptomyces sp. V4I23]
MPIRAVIWDIDDTLFDYDSADREAALGHLEAEGCLAAYASPEAAFTHWRDVMERVFGRFLAREITFAEHRRERVRTILAVARPGLRLTGEEADQWYARYELRYEAAWRIFPDVLPALDALTPGYRHGILSNSGLRDQERKLRAFGIHDRFEAVLCADELGLSKPAPEAFHAACEALGVRPDEAAYVGDRPDTDALAATTAGLTGIWLDRCGAVPAPTGIPRISTLAQLPRTLLGEPV